MDFRKKARWLRDKTVVGDVLRGPLLLLKRRGLRYPPRLYQHFGSRGVFQVEVPGGGSFRWIARGDVVENSIFWDGIYAHEGESIRAWVALSRSAKVVLDVGANTGLFALTASAVSNRSRVYAFEPVPRIAASLRENVSLNPEFSIEVVESAVGSETGTAAIFDPGGENAYSASLKSDFLDADLLGREKTTYPVAVTRVDDFVAARALHADLIKLDVEGFEPDALEGMAQTLQRDRPSLLIEVLPGSSERLLAQLQGLVQAGYGYYLLTDDGLIESRSAVRPRDNRNVLLCTPERLPSALGSGLVRAP
jgi:FkbM family methyltransferase